MKPEEQRIAIAEACGYSNPVQGSEFPDLRAEPPESIRGRSCAKYFPVPDYLNDLNAMHEAEKTLPQPIRFIAELYFVVQGLRNSEWPHCDTNYSAFAVASMLNTTASQRAEAFLRTLNLWKES